MYSYKLNELNNTYKLPKEIAVICLLPKIYITFHLMRSLCDISFSIILVINEKSFLTHLLNIHYRYISCYGSYMRVEPLKPVRLINSQENMHYSETFS